MRDLELYHALRGNATMLLLGLLLTWTLVAFGEEAVLWVPIIAHGVTDTVDLTLLFMGKYPGM
jgi:hypothetical protein